MTMRVDEAEGFKKYRGEAANEMVEASLIMDQVCGYGGVDSRCDCKRLGVGTSGVAHAQRSGAGEFTGCVEARIIAKLCRRIIRLYDSLVVAESDARQWKRSFEKLEAEMQDEANR